GLAGVKGPHWVVAAALEGLGALAVQQGHARRGVDLLAAAATLREEMGAPVRPADRPALDRALEAARRSLGDAAFAGAWASVRSLPAGRALSSSSDGPPAALDPANTATGR